MMPPKKTEYLHSYLLLLLSLVAILILFLPLGYISKVLIWAMMLRIYLKNGLSFKNACTLFGLSFIFSFMFVLLGILYPTPRLMHGEIITIVGFSFYQNVIWSSVDNFIRIFLLSHLSMSSSYAISYTKVILYLIVNKRIPASFGYPLLIAINSIALFKDEFIKIRIASKYRSLSLLKRVFILFPLLVFAIRQAQRGAMSLVTRGLNRDKNYYYKYEITRGDRVVFKMMLLFIFSVLVFLKVLAIII